MDVDLTNRDPNNINDHLKVIFYFILRNQNIYAHHINFEVLITYFTNFKISQITWVWHNEAFLQKKKGFPKTTVFTFKSLKICP